MNVVDDKIQFIISLQGRHNIIVNQWWIMGGDLNIVTSLSDKKGGIQKIGINEFVLQGNRSNSQVSVCRKFQ